MHLYTHPTRLRLSITGYRLLTTISVSLFGIVKAYFAYRTIPHQPMLLIGSLGLSSLRCKFDKVYIFTFFLICRLAYIFSVYTNTTLLISCLIYSP